MLKFLETKPTLDAYWRGIILFGQNSASYKFALAKSLLEIANQGKTFIKLEELAIPFSNNLITHLKISDKQGTSPTSKFLTSCREYINGNSTQTQMIDNTIRLGFVNVIDAFHKVNRIDVPQRFYIDERKTKGGIEITDNLFQLKDEFQFSNLPYEVEARWRLVEHSWSIGISSNLLQVEYDIKGGFFFTRNQQYQRIDVTSARHALNGYQKGKCFYCFKDISISNDQNTLMDVDHFFPHILKQYIIHMKLNIDGVWNLVLACQDCNRGVNGKFVRIPELYLLERLERRNNFLIESHHPLRDTLLNQTGNTIELRRNFLKNMDKIAIEYLLHRWSPSHEEETAF